MAADNEEIKEQEQPEAAEETVAAEEPAAEQPEATEEVSEKEKYEAELASLKDQLLRTAAEYDNHRKRSAKEKLELRPEIISSVVSEFLPVMDNLVRALETECSDEAYKKGVQMIYDSFMDTLKKLGVEEIESDGVQFDPTKHQAVQRVDDETLESGMVAKTFAKGYKINDKVIRFAIVAVVN